MPLTHEDHEEIRQLLARLNFALDLGDIDRWVACFTPDGSWEGIGFPDSSPFAGTHAGRAALNGFAETHYGIYRGRGRHGNFNVLIDGDGDTATVQSYADAYGTGRSWSGTGIYRDTLLRTPDGWRFSSRRATVDATADR